MNNLVIAKKIEVVSNDLIRAEFDYGYSYEAHLNGPNFVIIDEVIYEEWEPIVSDYIKAVWSDMEDYLQADYEERLEMLNAEELVQDVNDFLDDYHEVIMGSRDVEFSEVAQELEDALSGLTDGHLIEGGKSEMAELLKDAKFLGNVEKERQEMLKMENLTFEQMDAMVNQVNSWNGSLELLQAYSMDEFDDILSGMESFDVARMVAYGEFNPSDDFFKFDGYGNLESLSRFEYQELLEDHVEDIMELAQDLDEQGAIDLEDILG